MVGYANLVAQQVAPKIPDAALVPIPRSLTRRLKYGVDPARVIADRIGVLTGNPVIPLLVPPVHTSRRAGNDHTKAVARFRLKSPVKVRAVIVDDVVTTGATITRAIEAIGSENVRMVVAANAADRVSSLRSGQPI